MRALPFLLVPFLVAAGASSSPEEPPVGASPIVRVKLTALGAPTRLVVSAPDFSARDGKGTEIAVKGDTVTLTAAGKQVRVGEEAAETVRLEAEMLTVGEGRRAREYPGALLVSASGGRLRIVNETTLELYAEGVLAGECPALFHPEAIRAMAVAARSYSYRKAFLARGELCDTTHCQVYRAACSVKDTIREAVRATEGMVALYEGEVIDAVYSSDCGGYTEGSESAWRGGKVVPYLRPVEDAPEPEGEAYCAVNRAHRWTLNVTKQRLASLVGKTAPAVNLKITDFTESGRVAQLRLEAEAAAQKVRTFSGDQWRRLLGLSAVKSLKFDIRETPTGIQLEGRGYGHGVGLCFGEHGGLG